MAGGRGDLVSIHPVWRGNNGESLADRVKAELCKEVGGRGKGEGRDGDEVEQDTCVTPSREEEGSRSKEVIEDFVKGEYVVIGGLAAKGKDKVGRRLAAPAATNEFSTGANIGGEGGSDGVLELSYDRGCITAASEVVYTVLSCETK